MKDPETGYEEKDCKRFAVNQKIDLCGMIQDLSHKEDKVESEESKNAADFYSFTECDSTNA